MTKVMIVTQKPFSEDAKDAATKILKEGGLEVKFFEKYADNAELKKKIGDAEGIIIRSDNIDRDVFNFAKKLKLVVRAGAGFDNVDLECATEKGIIVENTPGQNANAVAELAMKLMHKLARPLNGKVGHELSGKKLGVHGFGNIGKIVARLGKAYGMKVFVYDPFLSEDIKEDYVIAKTLEELYENADFISLHIPKKKDTIGIVNYDLLKLMKNNGRLINTARAEIINEKDLIKIFEERSLFKYGSDVLPTDEILEILKNKFSDRFIFTPKKQGAQTHEANYNAATSAAKQCIEFFVNGNILNKVNN